MSKVLYYYAKLNENDICYGFETLAKKFRQEELPSNLIPLPDYNESLLWKKWDRELKAWSSESYEPSLEVELQERLEELENENNQLKNEIYNLNDNIQLLEGTIAELMTILATVGGAE